jgi:hypothetical protein
VQGHRLFHISTPGSFFKTPGFVQCIKEEFYCTQILSQKAMLLKSGKRNLPKISTLAKTSLKMNQ